MITIKHTGKRMRIRELHLEKLNPWIIADTHFFHKNIVDYTRRPKHHNELIAYNWGYFVQPDDYIIHLGDFALGRRKTIRMLTQSLPGKKYLIRGNHDRHSRSFYERCGWEAVTNTISFQRRGWEVHLTHRPNKELNIDDGIVNIHGHIHNRSYREPFYINASVELNWYAPVRLLTLVDHRIEVMRCIGS